MILLKAKILTLKKINFSLLLIGHLSICQSQSIEKKEINRYFDQSVGTQILGINNGKIHIDPYTYKQEQHNYYLNKNFIIGSVFYDNQLYENIMIKYDIYKDELVKSFEKSNSFGITLITEKVVYFLIDNHKFINSASTFSKSKVLPGFIEEKYLGKTISFYIKHSKSAKDAIVGTTLYTEFKEATTHQLLYNFELKTINTQKEITTLFPLLKSEIKNYYRVNKVSQENNADQFKADLIQFIDQNLPSTSTKI
ncbi:hypothetical protein [Flavobacterium sp. TAB 87]|uniref:hypothetical protein n=1 Tax=Flavobacterium sp. TAB 87 TaxID=1729581 RepID=UPI00076CB4E3|nr:hypothetical protein [Flavobacterium sp. TAB 87]KVV14339.1 hypothetical protein AP058_02231 [Flavobacterium sp. TAB 87]